MDMNNQEKVNTYRHLGLAIIGLILAIFVIGISYAFYTVFVRGESNPNVITSGEMKLTFTDGPAVSLNNAIPGDSITKSFSVKNTGNIATSFDIYLSELCNLFVDKSDLIYSITNDNGYSLVNNIVPSIPTKIVNSQVLQPNDTYNYTLTISFINDSSNQNGNINAKFSAKLNINDYKLSSDCS